MSAVVPFSNADHWSDHARQWGLIGAPLRPSPEDVAITESLLTPSASSPLRALLLGVTPELATLRWPEPTELLAVDRSAAMIGAIWPADRVRPGARAVEGDWLHLPVESGALDVVLGDGCYPLLPRPDGHRALGRELRRVLAPGGKVVMRFFVRPEIPESVETIVDQLFAGAIRSFHHVKWRLLSALHGALADGVRLGDVWDAWSQICPDPGALADRLGWPREVICTIDNYRDVDTRYTLHTLSELRALLAEEFTERACRVPRYELGERFPTLALEPR